MINNLFNKTAEWVKRNHVVIGGTALLASALLTHNPHIMAATAFYAVCAIANKKLGKMPEVDFLANAGMALSFMWASYGFVDHPMTAQSDVTRLQLSIASFGASVLWIASLGPKASTAIKRYLKV